jgi:hypothetical protein
MVRYKWLVVTIYRPELKKQKGEENHTDRGQKLPFHSLSHQKKCNKIGKGKLCQNICQSISNLAGTYTIKCPTEEKEPKRSFKRVVKSCLPGISSGPTFGEGEGHGHTNYKHEKGLYKIPKMQSVPWMVIQLISNERYDGSIEVWISQISK